MPGRNLTMELLSRETNKRMLKSLVERLYHEPLSWGIEEPATVPVDTILAALALIELLSDNVVLPQIAPDGEGGLALRWETLDHRFHLLGVDGWHLHFIFNAGRADARYFDDLRFSGDAIPSEIVALLG
jgi:hypothetical protein